MNGIFARAQTRLLLLSVVGAFAVPTAAPHLFAGLPFSDPLEFGLLALVLVPCLSATVRRYLTRLLRRQSDIVRGAVLLVPLAVIIAKVSLAAFGATWGFRACYTSLSSPLATGPCERSFELPFAPPDLTRIDRNIRFGADEWRLSFVNSLRFNYYPSEAGSILRDRLPFTARWQGVVSSREPTSVEAMYVGAATVLVEGHPAVTLAESYDEVAATRFTIRPGRHRVVIDYRFDDGYRTGASAEPGPPAQFALLRAADDGTTLPLAPAGPPFATRVTGWLIDSLLAAWLGALALVVSWMLRREWLVLAGWAVGLGVVQAAAARQLFGVSGPLALSVPVTAAFVMAATSRRHRRAIAACMMVVLVAILRALQVHPDWHSVGIRSAGDDWLAYESFARSILETWSLEGGEPVFYYQPLYRYFRFAQRMLFGDGDPILVAASLGTILAGLAVITAWAARGGAMTRVSAIAAGSTGAMLVLSPAVMRALDLGLSESATWVALPFVCYFLFCARAAGSQMGGAALLAACAITRINQAPALALAFMAYAMRAWREGWRRRLGWATVVVAGILLLPLVHNLVYGGRAVPATTSAGIEQNLVFRPAELPQALAGGEARDRLVRQVRGTLGLVAGQPANFGITVRLIQVLWLACTFVAVRQSAWYARVLHVVPVAFLLPHLFYQVTVYYPRHVVAGYLAMAVISGLQVGLRRGSPRLATARESSTPRAR